LILLNRNVGPNLPAFANARGAAYKIFETIDRVPIIDTANPGGAKPANLQGHIVVKDVDFSYPSRPDVPILKKMNVEIKPGQTIALVGQSGSGKSTIVGLVERFYDPVCKFSPLFPTNSLISPRVTRSASDIIEYNNIAGSVTLDGIEIKDYNVTFLRDSIGIVSQEPVLFNASIKQNIAYGIRRDQAQPSDEEIENACRLANAHDFISRLPDKYDTMVGEKGALLSGGQKQRIAIARALIKNPRILVLDEATSALDTESERIVQEALDKASTGRSTIVVAHRLSTIMNADVIYVMEKGIVIESGTHKTLLEKGGVYADLVAKQQLKTGGKDVDRSEDVDAVEQVRAASAAAAAADKAKLERTASRRSANVSRMLSNRLSILSMRTAETSVDMDMDDLAADDTAANQKKQKQASIRRVVRIMRPEWTLAFIGAFASMVSGAVSLSKRHDAKDVIVQ